MKQIMWTSLCCMMMLCVMGCKLPTEYTDAHIAGNGQMIAACAFSHKSDDDHNQLYRFESTHATIISTGDDGSPGNGGVSAIAVSPDGSYIVYLSDATNKTIVNSGGKTLPRCFVYHVSTGKTTLVQSIYSAGSDLRIGRYPYVYSKAGEQYLLLATIVQPSNSAPYQTIFNKVFLKNDQIVWQKTMPKSDLAISAISGDGNKIVYSALSDAGLDQFYCYDCLADKSTLVSQLPSEYFVEEETNMLGGAAVNADGRYIAFAVSATKRGEHTAKYYLFLRDTVKQTTTCISNGMNGRDTNDSSGQYQVCMSKDGRYIAFESLASNLVPRDTTKRPDVFLYDAATASTRLISVDSRGRQLSEYPLCGQFGVSMDDNGEKILFSAYSRLYLYQRKTGKTLSLPSVK